MTCSVCGREETPLRRGMCRTHYRKLMLYGDPLTPDRKPGAPARKCSIDGCGRRHHGDGLCGFHWWRRSRYGDPLAGPPSAEDRYRAKLAPPNANGCILWTGLVGSDGYGKHSVNRRTVRAHRYGWELAFGPIPDGMLVCHRCDVPLCQNPEHWFLGTPKDNMADKVGKGRHVGNPHRGGDGKFISG